MPKPKPYTEVRALVPTEVYDDFIERLKTNGATIDDFFRIAMLGYSRMPSIFGVDDVLTFGKYRGEKVGDIIRVQPDYIEYCLRKVQGFRLSNEAAGLLGEVTA